MTLIDAHLKKEYRIKKIDLDENLDLGLRLLHLGFIEGSEIIIDKKSPLKANCLLVEIRGAKIALTKDEARMIKLEIV